MDCRFGELFSMDARPIVRHGSTTVGQETVREDMRDYAHSPFVQKILLGCIFHPPYLLTFSTLGLAGKSSGKGKV